MASDIEDHSWHYQLHNNVENAVDNMMNTTTVQSTSGIRESIYIQHPLCNVISVRQDSDYTSGSFKAKNGPGMDCIGNQNLRFGPVSAFIHKQIVLAVVFEGPLDGRFYMAPHKIVHDRPEGKSKVANPFIMDLQKHASTSDDYLSFTVAIAKGSNTIFKSPENDPNGNCVITDFFSGEQVSIDKNFLKELAEQGKLPKQTQKRRHVGTTTISQYIDVHTVRLIMCPYDENSTNEKIKWKPEILFCSNEFKPVIHTTNKSTFKYESNLLTVNSGTTTFSNIDKQWNINISIKIPPMYECTNLKNKYIKIKITDPKSLYHFKDNERKIKSKLIPVHQLSENLQLVLVKLSPEEYERTQIANRGLPISTSTSTEPFHAPSSPCYSVIDSCDIQLLLCDKQENELVETEYPRSAVKHSVLGFECEFSQDGEQISSSDDDTDKPSSQMKRTNEKNPQSRTGSPVLKSLKMTDSKSCNSSIEPI